VILERGAKVGTPADLRKAILRQNAPFLFWNEAGARLEACAEPASPKY
jgi:hypothetical protein